MTTLLNEIAGANAGFRTWFVEKSRVLLRLWPGVARLRRWMNASRITFLLVMTIPLLTGCYTYTQAPGAVGKVVDADTGAPVNGARITRPFITGGPSATRPGLPWEGLPAVTVTTDRTGRFNLPPAVHTEIAFMSLHNPTSISGRFIATAPGYTTNEVQGSATSRCLWRADLGHVLLRKP